MALFVNYGSRVINLPYEATLGRMNGATAEQLRVLIYICSNEKFREDPDNCRARAISDLHMAWADIEKAMKYWTDVKVLLDSEPKLEFIPEKKKSSGKLLLSEAQVHTSEETAGIIEEDTELKVLINDLGQVLGKMLITSEIYCLVSMHDYLHLPSDFILELGKYCVEIDKRSVAYMSRMATTLFDADIVTKPALEEYLKRAREKDNTVSMIRKLFGLGSRALIAKEKRFIALWTEEYCLPYDLIEYAYELTIGSIKEPSMDYCNGIIKKWHAEGISTLEAAKQRQEDKKAKREKQANGSGDGFDVDEFMELALKRSYKNKK